MNGGMAASLASASIHSLEASFRTTLEAIAILRGEPAFGPAVAELSAMIGRMGQTLNDSFSEASVSCTEVDVFLPSRASFLPLTIRLL